jgi:hypothetical protein
MKPNRKLWRIATALLISIALNGILLAIDFSIGAHEDKLSTIEDVVVELLRPAEALTMWLAPGHGGVQILALAVFSVFFYTVAAWIILSLPIWSRHRT